MVVDIEDNPLMPSLRLPVYIKGLVIDLMMKAKAKAKKKRRNGGR
jgi:hypothetical protein